MSNTEQAARERAYAVRLTWKGNLGNGTADYTSYGRAYGVVAAGKPELVGTADPAYRGEPDKYNPEELFLASVTACHMLFYLSLCARRGVRVLSYEDDAHGTLAVRRDGGGSFDAITLSPAVTIAAGGDEALAEQLHETAHELCFIASSCSVPIRVQAKVRTRLTSAADVPIGDSHG